MKRTTLALACAAALLLSGCGDDTDTGNQSQAGDTPSASATVEPSGAATAASTCKATDGGTKDLKVKPVYTIPKDLTEPTKTTVTDIVCGTGPAAADGSAVTVKYVGVDFKTGEEFDASWKGGADNTFPFTIGSGVIPGFSIGVTGMQEGGRRLVVIPPGEGYGDGGPVPGGTLAFLIDLVDLQ